jgi:hypothetical protein
MRTVRANRARYRIAANHGRIRSITQQPLALAGLSGYDASDVSIILRRKK